MWEIIFILGCLSGMAAAVLTNPFELLKTRKQLSRELKKKKDGKFYFEAIRTIMDNEGLIGFQRGLAPVCLASGIAFAFRVCSYNYAFSQKLISTEDNQTIVHRAILFCGITGIISQVCCNPLHLMKTKIQNKSFHNTISLQGAAMNTRNVSRYIYQHFGIAGFLLGTTTSIPKGFVQHTSQLIGYYTCRDLLAMAKVYERSDESRDMLAAIISGVFTSVCISPLDLVLTRIHNQPLYSSGKGILYKGFFDCSSKVYNKEGFGGFYKGFGMMYLRIGPQAALSLFIWDRLKSGAVNMFDTEKLPNVFSRVGDK